MSKMVEVVIDSVRVSLTNQQRIVVLRDLQSDTYLPIWIGPYEAESITIALQEIEVARPQTHDLLKNVFNMLNAHLLRVEIINLREDVFYANLVVELNDQVVNIDSRPSDALALAVRTNVSILVAREVLDTAGIHPEQDIQEDGSAPAPDEGGPEESKEKGEDRLSVFEDFLDNLDLNDLSNPPDEDEPDENDSGQDPDHV
ncbi:MAG: bifunctional nuclease family protein [Anaerolineae bacterium]|nr:bifunctional nuclease family protein [Anaerolineae bacterium]